MMHSKNFFCLALLALALTPCCRAEPLATAQALVAGEYSGWTYGQDPAKKQVDCVQFVARVLEKELGRPLTVAEKNAVCINPPPANLATAVTGGDPQTKGVQHALADLIKRGDVVAVADVKTGDLIQYWIKKSDGTWMGHSGVVSKVSHDAQSHVRVNLIDAHETPAPGAIGSNDFNGTGLNLSDPARFIYLVRFK